MRQMKTILILAVSLFCVTGMSAQQSGGDYFEGLSRKIGFSRMIPPHGLEVTYEKTVHIIFPAPVKYVDLGNTNLVAGKADGAENVLRVKAAVRNFTEETNMSVITEDGDFFSFNVKYMDEPLLLNIEMCDFIHDGEAVNRPNNAMDIYLTELENESPRLVRLIMKSVYRDNKRRIRHIGSKRFGVQFLLKGLYTHGDLLYFHTRGLRELQDRGQENHEADRHAGTGGLPAPCLPLHHPCGREEKGTQRLRAAEVHPAGRQEAGGGTGGEARRQAPGIRSGK